MDEKGADSFCHDQAVLILCGGGEGRREEEGGVKRDKTVHKL